MNQCSVELQKVNIHEFIHVLIHVHIYISYVLYLLKCWFVKSNYFWVRHFTTSVTKSYIHLWNFWRRAWRGMTNKPFLRKLFHFVCSHYPLVSLLAFVSSTKTLSTACKSPCETLCLTCWHKRNHLSRFPPHPLPAQWVTFRLKSIIRGGGSRGGAGDWKQQR